jgi:hypothetical protein
MTGERRSKPSLSLLEIIGILILTGSPVTQGG